jgi:hypothetical protein
MLAGDGQGQFQAERVDPIGDDLAEQFRSIGTQALSQVRRGTHVPYSSGRKPDRHEIAVTSLDQVPPLVAALDTIGSYKALTIFDPNGAVAEQVDLYVVAVQSDGATRYFLRKTSSKKRLKRTNRITAIWRGSVFETLEDDPVLFDSTFDAVVEPDDVYILNQDSFERSLGFLEAARREAETTVRQATAGLAIANKDEFINAVTSDLNMVSKTRAIAERVQDPAYATRMTVANLIAVAHQHTDIELDWTQAADGSYQLQFHSDASRRWRILKVLDDDYVQSLVTDLVYESNSKNPIQ